MWCFKNKKIGYFHYTHVFLNTVMIFLYLLKQRTADKLVSLGDLNYHQHIQKSASPLENIKIKND